MITKEQEKKLDRYAQLVFNQISEMFDEDCENHIDQKELAEGENATLFFHALATMAPAVLYTKMTGEQTDFLGFTHITNRLSVQYMD